MTLKLEVGKSYRRADGAKCTVLSLDGLGRFKSVPEDGTLPNSLHYENGRALFSGEYNLIAEWEEPLPHGHARLPCGKVVDLTNPHGTAFGLLDDVYGKGTQKAMRAHGGQIEFYTVSGWSHVLSPCWFIGSAYRVAPKREPRTWWIVDGCKAWDNEQEARANADGREVVKVVEVME